MIKVYLKKDKEKSVQRLHPWIFSGAIDRTENEAGEGSVVTVYSSKNTFLCIGYFTNSSISVRVLSFREEEINADWWTQRFEDALRLRQTLGYTQNPDYNAYRFINGEGDGIPGLIIDSYQNQLVVQFHNEGISCFEADIRIALEKVFGSDLAGIHIRYASKHKNINQQEAGNAERIILENGIQFKIDFEKGQKTGFFLDQRNNRKLLMDYAKGKKVLNTFCYTGGFSLYALKAGASKVVSVDSSAYALEVLNDNLDLNNIPDSLHQSVCADATEYLREISDEYDLIILDPPAFAKSLKARHNAVQAYKRINKAALKSIQKGGILFTFSCSQAVDKELFEKTIYSAALESGCNVKILHHLGASPDHPVSLFHAEGEYLKGLVLYIY